MNLKELSKENKERLNRLMGYTSSHCNLSIAITCQAAFDLSPSIRRMANLFIVFKQIDISSFVTLASRLGLKKEHMLLIMSRLLPNCHDSLWIDTSRGSPAPYRINGFNPITLQELDNVVKSLNCK